MSASSDVEGITSEQITTIEQNPPNPDTDPAEGLDNPTSTKLVSTQSSLSESSTKIVPLVGRRGGPRTSTGKERSKHNALKLGFFSKAVVLNFESRSEFDALLRGFRYDLKPEGMLEETLLLKLATILWRWRRLLLAESGEVQKGIESWMSEKASLADERAEYEASVDAHLARTDTKGLISEISKPEKLDECLERLLEVKNELERFGFTADSLWIPLGRVYGARVKGRSHKDFYDFYNEYAFYYQAPEEQRKKAGFISQQDCLQKCLSALEMEIQRLRGLRKQPRHDKPSLYSDLHLMDSGFLRRSVPAAVEVERLQRYEGHLERAFDRTLSQLERFLRIRHGLPVLPTINVKTSG